MTRRAAAEGVQNDFSPQTPMPPICIQKRMRGEVEETPESEIRAAKKNCVKEDDHLAASRACDEAVFEAIRLFKEHFLPYLTDKYVHEKEEEMADEGAEKRGRDKCNELRKAFAALLPSAGQMEYVIDSSVASGGYDVVQIRGQEPPTHLDYYNKMVEKNEWDDALEAQLDLFRCQGPQARVWDGLLALAAVMGSRKEKNWLDQNDCKVDVEEGLKKLGMFKDEDLKRLRRSAKGMKWRQNAVRGIVREILRVRIYGYFAHYLASSKHHLRLAVARNSCVSGQQQHIPAAIVITSELPLWDALHFHTEDRNGSPFHGAARGKSYRLEDNAWLKEPGRQFAFQEANVDVDFHDFVRSRKLAKDLEPNAQLKRMLLSSEPVLLLDVVASLAPRDLARSEGLSVIVKAEIKRVFAEAKTRRQAVVLELGSGEPHDLAKKVYLPLGAEYGLRCGYLRWRDSSEKPWSREGVWEDRGCICQQMP
jgi:hypothetical protein